MLDLPQEILSVFTHVLCLLMHFRSLKVCSCFPPDSIQTTDPLSFLHDIRLSRPWWLLSVFWWPFSIQIDAFPSGLCLSQSDEYRQGTAAETFPKLYKERIIYFPIDILLCINPSMGICLLLKHNIAASNIVGSFLNIKKFAISLRMFSAV